jgi:hypothetical protein
MGNCNCADVDKFCFNTNKPDVQSEYQYMPNKLNTIAETSQEYVEESKFNISGMNHSKQQIEDGISLKSIRTYSKRSVNKEFSFKPIDNELKNSFTKQSSKNSGAVPDAAFMRESKSRKGLHERSNSAAIIDELYSNQIIDVDQDIDLDVEDDIKLQLQD